VKPNEAWYAFNVTVIKSIEYPMEATFISEKDWTEIMGPMVGIVLQGSKFGREEPQWWFLDVFSNCFVQSKFMYLGLIFGKFQVYHRQLIG
jgi:hypothetical protein